MGSGKKNIWLESDSIVTRKSPKPLKLNTLENIYVKEHGIKSKITKQFYQDNCSLKSNIIWDVFQDNKGKVWIATDNGLNFYNVATNEIRVNTNLDKKLKNLLSGKQYKKWIKYNKRLNKTFPVE